MNVFRKRDIEKVQENLVTVINPSKKIKDLEKKLKFSETFENQVTLADAYLEEEMYSDAIDHYKSSLKDVFKNDFYVISKVIEAYYYSSNFEEVIEYTKKIEGSSKFKKSKASFLYGMALDKKDVPDLAEEQLRTFDAPYSNFMERLELARFLVRQKKEEDGIVIYNEMILESESMSKQGSKMNRNLIKKAKEEVAELT